MAARPLAQVGSYYAGPVAAWQAGLVEREFDVEIIVDEQLTQSTFAFDPTGDTAWLNARLSPAEYHQAVSQLARALKFGPDGVPELTQLNRPRLIAVNGITVPAQRRHR